MKFDAVVGNPPYKLGHNSNFYVSFIEKTKEVLNDGGHFGFVIPNRFLNPASVASRKLRDWINITHVCPSVNKHFPGIATHIGVVQGIKTEKSQFTKIPFLYEDGTVLIRSLNEPTPITKPTVISTNIVSKVFTSTLDKMKTTSEKGNNYVFVDVTYCRYRSTTPTGGEKTLVARVNQEVGNGSYVNFESVTDADLNSWWLSRSKLGRYVIFCFANSSFANNSPLHNGFMPKIPAGTAKTDAAIYKLFNLTADEILEIEKIML